MIGLIKRLWRWFWAWFRKPNSRLGQGLLILIGLVGGIIFWGGFNTAMEATNSLEFCISCHEMRDTVYVEYQQSIHYKNPAGVRATCPDCHVPHAWIPKLIRKFQASNELWHKLIGTVDTREKFNAHRLEMATRVWDTMKSTDSRECRNCHSFNSMDFANQSQRARDKMEPVALGHGTRDANTCIDCHKGIAHKNPEPDEDE